MIKRHTNVSVGNVLDFPVRGISPRHQYPRHLIVIDLLISETYTSMTSNGLIKSIGLLALYASLIINPVTAE